MLELPGAVFLLRWRGTPEGGGNGPGVDAVVDAVEVLWGDGEGNARGRWYRSGFRCSRGCC